MAEGMPDGSISRSGRVRKKSAKVIEMEDFDDLEAEVLQETSSTFSNRKRSSSGKSGIMSPMGDLMGTFPAVEQRKRHASPGGGSSLSPAHFHQQDPMSKHLGKMAGKARVRQHPVAKQQQQEEPEPDFGGLAMLAEGSLMSEGDLKALYSGMKASSKPIFSDEDEEEQQPLEEEEEMDVSVDDDDDDDDQLVIAEPHRSSSAKQAKKRKSTSSKAQHGGTKRSPFRGKKIKEEPYEMGDARFLHQQPHHHHARGHQQQHAYSVGDMGGHVGPSSSKKPKKPKPEKKDKNKKKARVTAYMLWCREHRKKVVALNPSMDFATISRKLGELWMSQSDKEKLCWRRKAKRLAKALQGSNNMINTGGPPAGGNKPPGSVGRPPAQTTSAPTRHHHSSSSSHHHAGSSSRHQQQHHHAVAEEHINLHHSPTKEGGGPMFKVVGTAPIDVAAHLSLLGESLTIIGHRLTEHEGQIAVSGSLSVLLDSTLCALGPLLCLANQIVPACNQESLSQILDNIAYIMPGL